MLVPAKATTHQLNWLNVESGLSLVLRGAERGVGEEGGKVSGDILVLQNVVYDDKYRNRCADNALPVCNLHASNCDIRSCNWRLHSQH